MEFDGLIAAAETFRNAYPGFRNRGIGGNVGEVAAIPELAERGRQSLARFFERLDQDLANTRYVAGDEFTVAVIALCAVDFARLQPWLS